MHAVNGQDVPYLRYSNCVRAATIAAAAAAAACVPFSFVYAKRMN